MGSEKDVILGIDLGTTNSSCAVWEDDSVRLIPNVHGELLTPSVVAIDDDDSALIGKSAKQRFVTHPHRSVAYFKRFMGTNHRVLLGKRHEYSAPELSAMVLRSLKADAERVLQQEIGHAVISVPAYFNDSQRQATRDAGEIAGLSVNRLINEPTAAALAHGLDEESERRFIVLDLGGGTFDVSILEYFDRILEVHATAGDSALGGEDFNEALVRAFAREFELEKVLEDPAQRQKLYVRAETAKRRLAANRPVQMNFESDGHVHEWKLDEATFTKATARLLLRLRTPMERALRDAGLTPAQINDVVLVGGATRMHVFRSMVSKLFGRLPRTDADPDLTVVRGAAMQAALVARDSSLDDVVLTDVCPFSLGIAAVNSADGNATRERMSPIIERNTVVPVSRIQRFFTVEHGQEIIAVRVYQGESRELSNNLFLGGLEVAVPRAAAGKEAVDVRFSYDVNGLLEVDVTVVSTEATRRKVIQNRPGELSETEKQKSLQRLESLKVLPRDRAEVRAVTSRADRIYASLLGAEREEFSRLMDQFEAVLDGQDLREIERACKDFSDYMDRIDEDIWQ